MQRKFRSSVGRAKQPHRLEPQRATHSRPQRDRHPRARGPPHPRRPDARRRGRAATGRGDAEPGREPDRALAVPGRGGRARIDAVLVTHRHRDHLDGRAERAPPARRPGLLPAGGRGARFARSASTRGRSSRRSSGTGSGSRERPRGTASGRMAELLAPVSGFVLDDLYLAGDTVWYEGVEETIERHRPRVAIVNAGGARVLRGRTHRHGNRRRPARSPRVCRRSSRCTWKRSTTASSRERVLAAAVPDVVIPVTARR